MADVLTAMHDVVIRFLLSGLGAVFCFVILMLIWGVIREALETERLRASR